MSRPGQRRHGLAADRGLYEVLLRLQPTPVIELNHAVAVSMVDGAARALDLVDSLAARGRVTQYHLLHAARGRFLQQLGRYRARLARLIARPCAPPRSSRRGAFLPHELPAIQGTFARRPCRGELGGHRRAAYFGSRRLFGGRRNFLRYDGSGVDHRRNVAQLDEQRCRISDAAPAARILEKPSGTFTGRVNSASFDTESIKKRLEPDSLQASSGVAGHFNSFSMGRRTRLARGCQSPTTPL